MTTATAAAPSALAQELLAAWDLGRCLPSPPSARSGGLDMAQAQAVAAELRALRRARGEQPRGWKIGFTNRGLWQRYGVHQPIWGAVWDRGLALLDGTEATLSLAGLCQPRLEPEIVFGIAQVPRPGMGLAEVQACIDWVAHGFEVVHTHCEGWRFTAADTVADFGLHGRLFVGPRVPAGSWPAMAADLPLVTLDLLEGETLRESGQGANVLDGPVQALQALVEGMACSPGGAALAAGDVVTTGTWTDAWPLQPGQVWRTRLSDARLAGLRLTVVV